MHAVAELAGPGGRDAEAAPVLVLLVASNKVVRVASDGTTEELADVPGGGAMVGSPAMWDAAARTWLVVCGGGLYAFNATSRGWTAGESGACEDLGEHASVL